MKIKPLLGIVLAVCLLTSSISCGCLRGPGIVTVYPRDFDYVVQYNYINDEYENIHITGYHGPGGDIAIPDTINGIRVVGIGDYAFKNCSSITSIMIPSSIEGMGREVFSGCTSLTNIVVDESNFYFKDIDGVLYAQGGLYLVCYPAGKTDYSFTLPRIVRSVSEEAFYGCTSLANIVVENSNYYYMDIDGALVTKDGTSLVCYPAGKRDSSYNIPSGVTNVYPGAFYGCFGLSSISIPSRVRMVEYDALQGDGAFYGCPSLSEIRVDASNTIFKDIDGVLFAYNGTSLVCYPSEKKGASYTIPNNVEQISNNAFSGCTSLVSITIPGSVAQIGDKAFSGCTSLTGFKVDASNPFFKDIDGVLFQNQWSGISLFSYPAGRADSSYTITGDISHLNRRAFDDCVNLISITIIRSDMYINWEAFSGCTSLTEIKVDASNINFVDIDGVLFTKSKAYLLLFPAGKTFSSYTIPASVKGIRNMAFRNCTNLTKITIPSSVEDIAWDAFWGCRNLTIICQRDSYAHSYCLLNGINFKLMP